LSLQTESGLGASLNDDNTKDDKEILTENVETGFNSSCPQRNVMNIFSDSIIVKISLLIFLKFLRGGAVG
jgi:hypothetical protein